jgi:hypothetical protein
MFIFSLSLALVDSLISVSTSTNPAATILRLASLVLFCILLFYLGFLSFCMVVGIFLSS